MSNSKEDEKLKKKLLIEELRCTYEHLRTVNNTIDSKSAVFLSLALITLSVIIASLISIFETPFTLSPDILKLYVFPFSENTLYQFVVFTLFIIIFSFILKGVARLFKSIRIKKFSDPFTYPPNDVLKLLNLNYKELEDYTIIEYRQANAHYHCIVDQKAELLKKGIKHIEYGFLYAFIALIVLIYLKIVSGIYA